jgi:plasmid segregation protein ParM
MNIGIDLGYSHTKIVSGERGERQAIFPSVVGTPEAGRFSLNGAHHDDIVLLEPQHVLVGEGALIQSEFLDHREDRGWVSSPAYLSLFLAGLTEVTAATSVDLAVVTGLPVAFYSDKDLVRERLLGNGVHRVQRAKRHAQTFRFGQFPDGNPALRVIPQPFGALLAQALDDNGRVVDQALAEGEVGVIDVGSKTTNLLSVRRMAEVGRQTKSVEVGSWNVARIVANYLEIHCPGLGLRGHELQEAIRKRQVPYFGQEVDLSALVDDTLNHLAETVIAEAGQLWNGGARLAAILVAGGGAHLLGDRIKAHFRHARVVPNPVFANASGYWKFARRLSLAAGAR